MLDGLLRGLEARDDFHFLVQSILDELEPDHRLKGKELEVDAYRKAWMREGIKLLYAKVQDVTELDEENHG